MTKACCKGFYGLMVLTGMAHAISCEITKADTRVDGDKTIPYVELTCPPRDVFAPLRVLLTLSSLSEAVPADMVKQPVELVSSREDARFKVRGKAYRATALDNITLLEPKRN